MENVSLSDRHPPRIWATSPALSEVLLNPRPRGFDTLAVVGSNVRAVEAGLLFSSGLVSFVALVGPSGWGKSHLLEAIASRIAEERGPRSYEMWSANEWVIASRTRTSHLALILDNVQDAMSKSRSRQQLRVALERRVKAGWPTVLSFTDSRVSRQVRAALPSFRDWSVLMVRPPDALERETVVAHMAQAEGVVLSKELCRILAHRLEGNGRTLLGALKRLRLNGAHWLTPQDVLRACGILDPFFASNSAWDLRDHISEVAGDSMEIGQNAEADLAVYAMLKIAQLGEADVARYLEIEPARAYAIVQKVEGRLRADHHARANAQAFVERVVSALQPA